MCLRLTDKLTERCKGQPMEESGLHFIDSLAELLRRLLDYRAVPHGEEYRDLHMHVVFNLLVRSTLSCVMIIMRYAFHLCFFSRTFTSQLVENRYISGQYWDQLNTLSLYRYPSFSYFSCCTLQIHLSFG